MSGKKLWCTRCGKEVTPVRVPSEKRMDVRHHVFWSPYKCPVCNSSL